MNQALVLTKTVDSVQGALWLASQTPNILYYLPPSNSGKNGVPGCIRDKRITQINDEAVPENTNLKAAKFGLAVFKGNGLSF